VNAQASTWCLSKRLALAKSELDAWALVDCFLVLVAPLAGDEIQGMKRGLMEQVDVLGVSKADLYADSAETTRDNYVSALSLLRGARAPDALLVDSVSGRGISLLWEKLQDFSKGQASETRAKRAPRANHAGRTCG
jgi:LAO/AO transport system kinase